jgi:GTPase-associated protein 1, N-terminal domain type 2/GTPase-associated protein 1, C-terminal domain/GTPase-associated protein 1, middle domain
VAFYQLHYTSCENGLSGYSGFQFCAATPGVPDFVMREVERQTVYEPPDEMQEILDKPLADFPVTLLHTYSQDSNTLIISRVQYTGLDFSNRSGNYFAHSLVSDSPDDDLALAMPVELWGAPFWLTGRGEERELPPLPPPSPSGAITPGSAADFARSRSVGHEELAVLLTAVEEAMTGGRQVLLIDDNVDAICRWIAAMSYLLGPAGGRRLTFSTYSYDPRRCQTHVVGTVTGVKPLRSDITSALHVFDPAASKLPSVVPDPAALLLARLGIGAAAEIWRLADSLAGPPGRTLPEAQSQALPRAPSQALPLLASAALMLGHHLAVNELVEAISWLHAQPGEMSAGRLAAAASEALRQSLAELPAAQKDQLMDIARRVDEAAPGVDGSQLRRTEHTLVAAALSEHDNGRALGEGNALQTAEGRKAVADGCHARLAGCDGADAIRLLVWAAAVGADLRADTVRQVGHDAIVTSLLDGHELPGLTDATAAWPQLRLGMVDRLASVPRERQGAILASGAATVFTIEDFTACPGLGEEWVISMVTAGRMRRVVALNRILRLRPGGGTAGEGLLTLLWPGQRWTPGEAVEIVRTLPLAALADQAVGSRLGALLRDIPGQAAYKPWTVLVRELLRLPPEVLPSADAQLAREFWRLIELSEQAAAQSTPDELIDEMLDRYATGNEISRKLLKRILPALMIRHRRLHRVLIKCDEELFVHFCEFSASELSMGCLTHGDIANLIVAMQLTELKKPQYSATLDRNVLRPVLSKWTRVEMTAVAREADMIARESDRHNSDRHVMFWYRRIRNNRFRLARIWTSGSR